MPYLLTKWNVLPDWEPTWPDECALELDEFGWEVRRVEIFRDGSVKWTDGARGTAETYLAEDATSRDLHEWANCQPELIEKAEFEALWAKAVSQSAISAWFYPV